MKEHFRANGYVGNKFAPGQLSVRATSLYFVADDKSGALELPIGGLTLRFGGHNDEQVFFENPALPGASIHCSDPDVLNTPPFQVPPFRDQIARFEKRRKRIPLPVYLFAAIGLFFLGVILALFLLKDKIVEAVTNKIPQEWEQKLGSQMISSMEGQQPFVTDPEYWQKLSAITNRMAAIAAESGYTFRFYVMRETNINAFALPGGYVVFHTGLIDAAESSEEIAGVLAHEMAHVTRRHGMRKIVEAAGLFLLVQAFIGDAEGMMALIADSSQTLMRQKFSRDFEREADDVGWEYLVRARIDPRGMTAFFDKLLQQEKNSSAGRSALSLLNTHPPTQERIHRLEQKWAQTTQRTFEPLTP